jgi:hypothetical protein
LKIAIVAIPVTGGGRVRAEAYKTYLLSKGHNVDLLKVDEIWSSRLFYFYQRTRAYLQGRESRLMRKIADKLESVIKKENYRVVICVESLFSYVLTRNLPCLKIFSWESMLAEELFYDPSVKNESSKNRIRVLSDMEVEICQSSDYVVFPWETTERFVRKNICSGSNFITIRYGCSPKTKPVSYSSPSSIVSVGNVKAYWANKELLSYLTSISPVKIDVFSQFRPERKYKLNYRGFAPSLNILQNYQFGLNTVTKDPFRRNHFSSRPLGYIAYGLPVLSPDWMQFSHDIEGSLPYNEENFTDLVKKYSEKDHWELLSKNALEQAKRLDWKITLEPLERIISNKT